MGSLNEAMGILMRAIALSTARRSSVFGLILLPLLLTSCMRQPDDVFLVTSDAVSVFTTKQESLAPSVGTRLATLEPEARVPVLECLDEGGHSIYKIHLSDGRMGFVNDGDYILSNSNYSDSVWCGAKPRNPQWQRGWVTDCVGPDFSKSAVNGVTGPGSERPVFRINHQLVLAVPKRYWPNAGSLGHEPRTCTKLGDLPTAAYLYFNVQGNWSSGYDQRNVPTVDGSSHAPPVQPDMVVVRIERIHTQSKRPAGENEAIQGIERNVEQDESSRARQIAGLMCADWCWGSNGPDKVSLRYWQRSTSFVEIHAYYESTRYGGLTVWWKSFTSDISHWRDIDDEVWKLIAEWKLSDTAEDPAE
jgi:hypothetical protein